MNSSKNYCRIIKRSAKHLILNDPIGIALEVYERYYPGRLVYIWFDPACQKKKKGGLVLHGQAQISDGKPKRYGIVLNPFLPGGAPSFLKTVCHELAHTIQWPDGHGAKFRKCFKKLYVEAKAEHAKGAWRKLKVKP